LKESFQCLYCDGSVWYSTFGDALMVCAPIKV
jgi:hypothetical protein